MSERELTNAELLRYSRHILLPEWDLSGQNQILHRRVLVVGCGGLGSVAALFLASSGVGNIVLADGDVLDLSNLQRQVGFETGQLGQNKALALAARLKAINPLIQITTLSYYLGTEELEQWVRQVDVVLDCSDRFATRYEVNRMCWNKSVPLLSGAAIRMEGQLLCVDSNVATSACYHCIFPEQQLETDESCALMGVLAPVVGVVGSLQALEALKILSGIQSHAIVNRLWLLEARHNHWREIALLKDPDCSVCGTNAH